MRRLPFSRPADCSRDPRLDANFSLDRIGDEALLVRALVQCRVLLRSRRSSGKRHHWPQRDLRDPGLVEHAHGLVDITVDHPFLLASEVQEPQHMAGGERGDETLLRVDADRRRYRSGDILRGCVSRHTDIAESDDVVPGIRLIAKLARSSPLDGYAVLAHAT